MRRQGSCVPALTYASAGTAPGFMEAPSPGGAARQVDHSGVNASWTHGWPWNKP
ncbi:hypothetical protein BSLA_03f0652 [Burkholderia stabilis]|nr:hypothetical protein BSLA_03f0652 [Burkholderia stabilis]